MRYWLISGTALIVLVVIIRSIVLNRCSKIVSIILWWMVILRLLIPVAIQSDFSIYPLFQKIICLEKSGIHDLEIVEQTAILGNNVKSNNMVRNEFDDGNIAETKSDMDGYFSKIKVLWSIGCIVLFVFFESTHLISLQKYRFAISVKNVKILEWMSQHTLFRRYEIKVLEDAEMPFSYGIIKPVIILPSKICIDSWESLQYVLVHEFMHIKNWDILTKWALVITLSIHWFNPMVWLMYLLANRDIELHCDECVIKHFGYNRKSIYAMTLVKMEENKIFRLPVSNCFVKTAIEERIRAIMKAKKNSLMLNLIIVIATMLVSICFISVPPAVNARSEGNILEKYREYLVLQYKNREYNKMTVSEYREKIYQEKSPKNFDELIDKIQNDSILQEYKNTNSEAAFLVNVLLPMVSESWNEYSFKEIINNGKDSIEYQFTAYIKEPNELLINKYEDKIKLVNRFLRQCLNDTEMISSMKKEEYDKIYNSVESFSDDKVNISLDFVQFLSDSCNSDDLLDDLDPDEGEDPENAFSVPATTEDFRYLLSIFKISNYEKMSIRDYRNFVDHKMIENELLERKVANVFLCLQRNNMKDIDISVEEQNFIAYTLKTTFAENRSNNDPLTTYLRIHDYPKELGVYIDFKLYYTILDESKCTVEERDNALIQIISGVEDCIGALSKDDFEKNNQSIVLNKANELAEENSSRKIKCDIQQLQWVSN